MRIVDRQGRVCGWVNVIDALALLMAVAVLAPTASYAGKFIRAWAVEMTVFDIEPLTLTAGEPISISIEGRNLGRAVRVTFGSRDASAITRVSRHRLVVESPQDIEPGFYPITLSDGLGQEATVPGPSGRALGLQVVSRPPVSRPVAIRIAEKPVEVVPKPDVYEDVPIMLLCAVQEIGRAAHEGVPDLGWETEAIRVTPIAKLHEQGVTLVNVFVNARVTVGRADRQFAITGEPLGVGKRLHLRKERLTGIVLCEPIVLERLSPTQHDGAS